MTATLKASLRLSNKDVQLFVAELQKENARLHKRIAKAEALSISLRNRVSAVERELKKGPVQEIKISWGESPQSLGSASNEEPKKVVGGKP